ncbi:MAG: NADH:ubiquinone oxidoreductase, partial [Gemmatimonadota bacterium]
INGGTDMPKPAVGMFGLTGCAGDQLTVLNCEDELLGMVELLDIRDFLTASSDRDESCPLDIAFVEGVVASKRDEERLRRIRARCDTLVALGTCAVCGGIPAMDRDFDRDRLIVDLYGPGGRQFDALPVRALHEVVSVNVKITGCPIEKHEFLACIASLLNGDLPILPEYPVCMECRLRENRCLLIHDGLCCLGPITLGGCHARCPSLGVSCVGCRGPARDANLEAAVMVFEQHGLPRDVVWQRLQTFAPVPDGRLPQAWEER